MICPSPFLYVGPRGAVRPGGGNPPQLAGPAWGPAWAGVPRILGTLTMRMPGAQEPCLVVASHEKMISAMSLPTAFTELHGVYSNRGSANARGSGRPADNEAAGQHRPHRRVRGSPQSAVSWCASTSARNWGRSAGRIEASVWPRRSRSPRSGRNRQRRRNVTAALRLYLCGQLPETVTRGERTVNWLVRVV